MEEPVLRSPIQFFSGSIFPSQLFALGCYSLKQNPSLWNESNYASFFLMALAMLQFVGVNWYSVILYENRVEKKYHFTGRTETIQLHDIKSWSERIPLFHRGLGRYRYNYELTLYSGSEDFIITKYVVGNYDDFKTKLTAHLAINKNPPEPKWDWVIIIGIVVVALGTMAYYVIKAVYFS